MCPPGVDQTYRTSQRWQIIAPRLRLIRPLAFPRTPLYEHRHAWLFGDELDVDAWSLLARSSPRIIPARTYLPADGPTKPLSALEALPAELRQLIVDAPSLAAADAVALGLSSPLLWPHVLQRAAHAAAAAPLAGVELATTGNYLTHVPPRFAAAGIAPSAAEQAAWDNLPRRFAGPGRGYRQPDGLCPARRFNWEAVSTYEEISSARDVWAEAWTAHVDAVKALPEELVAKLGGELLARAEDSDQADEPTAKAGARDAWVLRSLDTRQYVHVQRHAPQAFLERCASHPGLPTLQQRRGFVAHAAALGLSVDDALLLRTAWTAPEAQWFELGPLTRTGNL